MKKRLKSFLNSIYKFIKYNKQFCSYVILSLLMCLFLRLYTIGSFFNYSAFIIELGIILFIGAFGFFNKPQKQFYYYFVCLICLTTVCCVNAVYYDFYSSFASFSLITALKQVGEVGDAVFAKVNLFQFIYILFLVIFFAINRRLTNRDYFNFVSKFENSKSILKKILFYSIVVLGIGASTLSATAFSRLAKQWNREYIVTKFGIIVYQMNDLVNTLKPTITSWFGYDVALKEFNDYYAENTIEKSNNEYTNKFAGKNVIFVHMESMSSFLLDLNINGMTITPNLNKLSKDGIYFSNFYPQISVGTSSDTEFTLNSSLMPATNGTVFVSYYDREYVTIPKLFKELGYYTFSMHANKASMWNRQLMHPNLGYTDFYSSNSFDLNENIGLGLSDNSFFDQGIKILENIEKNNTHYMGTIITLSNHTPFANNDLFEQIDLKYHYEKKDDLSREVTVIDYPYLEDTILGDYIRSSHYADSALGKFIDYVENSDYFNDTIFIFYGDHDSKISYSDFNYYYNFNPLTGELFKEGDEEYIPYDYYANELNKKTPLIIWSKNKKYNINVDYYMGMIDVMPTIGNMFGIYNKYALGHDIFEIKENNIIAFPNGNILTNKFYYYNSKEEYKALSLDEILSEDYINYCKAYSDNIISVSNDIIVHDLIKNSKDGKK